MSDIDVGKLLDMPRSERVEVLFNFTAPEYQADLLDYGEEVTKAQAAPRKGRQVGASMAASAIAADRVFTAPGETTLITSPKQDPADELFEKFKQRFKDSEFSMDQLGVVEDNKTEWRFSNGHRVIGRTLGKGDLSQRGISPSCVIVDEAQDASDYHLEEVVEPFFVTHSEYEFYLMGTPRGKTGYFYESVEGTQSDEWYSPHWPTKISPWVDADYLNRKEREKDSTTFAQEYLGEFADTGEVWIPSDLFRSCVVSEWTENNRLDRFLGVDVARKGKDETVYCLIREDGVVLNLWKEATSTVPGVVGRIKSLINTHGIEQAFVDENAVGGGVVDDEGLRGLVEGITFSTKTKHDMYTTLKTDFENGEIQVPEGIDHYRSLEMQTTRLEFDFTSNGYLKVSHPPNGHDDFADALALANHGRKKGNAVVERTVRTNMLRGQQ